MSLKKIIIPILALLLSLPSFAQTEKYSKIKIHLNGKEIKELAKLGINVENGILKKGNYFIGECSENEIKILKKNNFTYDMLIEDMSKFYQDRNKNKKFDKKKKAAMPYPTPSNFRLGSMGGFYTYAEIMHELDTMRILFPNLVSVKQTIGVQSTLEGRQQFYVKISNHPNIDENKPEVLYSALTHAREPAGMQQLFFFMYYLLENYNTDTEVKYLVDNLEFYFVPCVNPDGYEYNHTTNPNGGGMWRKNRINSGSGNYGVDLNRNYGFSWGYDDQGSSPDPSLETYRGTGGFSEIETQEMKYFCEQRHFSMAIDYHCYSNVLIYPWGYLPDYYTLDSALFCEDASLMTIENNFLAGTASQTVGYTANGSSCDWFYGEQSTKTKIIAFSPEAGSSSDGFWPQITNIEDICRSDMGMNLYLARLALKYAQLTDQTPAFISNLNSSFHYKLKCLGLSTPADFTVSISALSPQITSVGTANLHSGMATLDEVTDSINFTLSPTIQVGQQIKFLISVNNGMYIFYDTITKTYGQPQSVFIDSGENMSNWTSTSGWNATSLHSHSPQKCITDSPNGDYSMNAVNSSVTTTQYISLANASHAYLSFWAMWDINAGQDYVQIKISTNGTTWIPLSGNYTKYGVGGTQPLNQPVYDGSMNTWVNENINLDTYLGQSVKFRFTLKSSSNYYQTYDGFYFDDFAISTLPIPLTNITTKSVENTHFTIYPIPTKNIIYLSFQNYSTNKNDAVSIYNIYGQKLYYAKITDFKQPTMIDVSTFASGLYFCSFQEGENSTTKKFTVVK